MKSIVYLSNGDRRNIPRLVEHEPYHCPWDAYKRTERYLSYAEYGFHLAGIIRQTFTIHEKINQRAEFIGGTAFHHWHHRALPLDCTRHFGRDYQWHVPAERIARSRFRKARRNARIGQPWPGYSAIDFSFGLSCQDTRQNLAPRERHYLTIRLELAATSRAPLPPFHLSDCWNEAIYSAA